MTPQQELFVAEYLKDLNGSQAAIRAGYSPNSVDSRAAQLLAMPNIKVAIDKSRKAIADRCGLDAQWVLERLKENAERALQTVPAHDKAGNETGEYTYEGQVANRALELIGKHLGMFVDRVDATSNGESIVPAVILIPTSGASKSDV